MENLVIWMIIIASIIGLTFLSAVIVSIIEVLVMKKTEAKISSIVFHAGFGLAALIYLMCTWFPFFRETFTTTYGSKIIFFIWFMRIILIVTVGFVVRHLIKNLK